MPGNDPRVDEYIRKAAPFAQPILKRVRKLVHQGCPEVQETIKWRFPHFDYKGPLLGMAAFKQHCSVGFWKGDLILGKEFGVDVRVIEDSLAVRRESALPKNQKKFSNKIVALMRKQFGGHAIHQK